MSFFSAEISTSTMLPFRELYNEGIDEYFAENPFMYKSNVYFIGKIKKVRFNVTKTIFTSYGVLNFCLVHQGKEYVLENKNLFEISEIARRFWESVEITKGKFTVQELFDFKIDYEESNSQYIQISIVALGSNTIIDYFNIKIEPFSVWVNDSIDFKNYPQIEYIGQSKHILTRFKKHSTLLKASSQLSDDEELLLFMLTFKIGYGGSKKEMNLSSDLWSLVQEKDITENKNYGILIDILERVLIYFYQPHLNDKHMKTPIEKDNQIQKLLKKENISGISICVGVEGKIHNFWSKNQKLKSELFSYDFNHSNLGFTDGLSKSIIGF